MPTRKPHAGNFRQQPRGYVWCPICDGTGAKRPSHQGLVAAKHRRRVCGACNGVGFVPITGKGDKYPHKDDSHDL